MSSLASIHCQLSGLLESMQYLLRLAGSLGLSLQVGRGRTAREETGEQWLNEGVEDNLGAAVMRLELNLSDESAYSTYLN